MNNKNYSDTKLLVGSLMLGLASLIGISVWSYTYGNPKYSKNNK